MKTKTKFFAWSGNNKDLKALLAINTQTSRKQTNTSHTPKFKQLTYTHAITLLIITLIVMAL